MKKLVLTLLVLGTHRLAIAQAEFAAAPQWQVALQVVDEDQTPVPGASVSASYYIPPPPSVTEAGSRKTGLTDTNGFVTLSALSDWGAHVDNYFMIDAAVPVEALDSTLNSASNMIHPDWVGYTNRLYAGRWFTLFPTNDSRNTLNWSGRLANLGGVDVYNFYSSGEEVLREHTGLVPSLVGLALDTVARSIFYSTPASAYVWALQEKEKGRTMYDAVLGSSHGGWGFNNDSTNYTWFITGGDGGQERVRLAPWDAALLPATQLQTNAFFDMHRDGPLFGSTGSSYTQTNRNRILADAIPALTLPLGANAVTNLDVRAGGQRNFDMQALYENGWPSGRPLRQVGALAPGEWWHSDFRQAAYTFTYKLFNELVNDGSLK